MSDQPHSFGTRLADAMRHNNISILELATKAGVSQRTVQRWLSGQHCPGKSTLVVHLAQLFNVPLDWLWAGNYRGHSQLDFCTMKFLEYWRQLPRHQRDQEFRRIIRIINNDPKEQRLRHLRDTGRISMEQYLSCM